MLQMWLTNEQDLHTADGSEVCLIWGKFIQNEIIVEMNDSEATQGGTLGKRTHNFLSKLIS